MHILCQVQNFQTSFVFHASFPYERIRCFDFIIKLFTRTRFSLEALRSFVFVKCSDRQINTLHWQSSFLFLGIGLLICIFDSTGVT